MDYWNIRNKATGTARINRFVKPPFNNDKEFEKRAPAIHRPEVMQRNNVV